MVQVDGQVAVFEGVDKLNPAPLRASDLRAGAAMVVAALMADGTETAEHLGYIPKQNIYIAENGQNIRLSADGMTVENTVTAGAVMVDGYGVGDVGNVVLRDRHHLSEDGIIIVTAAVDGSTGQVLSGPDLVSRGFVYVRESEELMDGARMQVEMALDRSLSDNMHDWASVKARVREALSSYIYRKTKRSPMILPILLEV